MDTHISITYFIQATNNGSWNFFEVPTYPNLIQLHGLDFSIKDPHFLNWAHGSYTLWDGLTTYIISTLHNKFIAHIISWLHGFHIKPGKNSPIPLIFEIISVLPLFEKYSAMYHFFKNRVCETRFWHGIRVYKNRVPWKVHLELEFMKLEFLVILLFVSVSTLSLPIDIHWCMTNTCFMMRLKRYTVEYFLFYFIYYINFTQLNHQQTDSQRQ